MSKKTIMLERRFFKNDDEWEYMLVQLGIDDNKHAKAEDVEFSVNTSSIKINKFLEKVS